MTSDSFAHDSMSRCRSGVGAAAPDQRTDRPKERPEYCVFATHYSDVFGFGDLARCWDRRTPARNLSKALAFSAIYVDFVRRYLGPDVQVVFVDSSPLDLAAFLRTAFPKLDVREMNAAEVTPSASDLVCIRFSNNIGHLSVHGQDGWGRACMKGIEYCAAAGYAFAVHVEADLLVRGHNWVRKFIRVHPDAGIIAPRMHLGLETGLFIARTAWIQESRFIQRYDWRQAENRPRPEKRFAAIAGKKWGVMNIGGGRGETGALTRACTRDASHAYLTHASPEEWKHFFEAAEYPLPDELRHLDTPDDTPAESTLQRRSPSGRPSRRARVWKILQRLWPLKPEISA